MSTLPVSFINKLISVATGPFGELFIGLFFFLLDQRKHLSDFLQFGTSIIRPPLSGFLVMNFLVILRLYPLIVNQVLITEFKNFAAFPNYCKSFKFVDVNVGAINVVHIHHSNFSPIFCFLTCNQ